LFVGYNREPKTPLDSSIFGQNDISLLNRAENILNSIYHVNIEEPEPRKPASLEELPEINQNLLVSKIQEEIDRAERYHNSFTLTIFRIYGLEKLLDDDHGRGLKVINGISSRLRSSIRKTDYFAWIEPDLFAVLSLESLGRIKTLEERLNGIIDSYLKSSGLYHPDDFRSLSSYTRFPGRAKTPSDLIREAKSTLKTAGSKQ
jgi:GGDEF domain-containing protein